MNRTILDRRPIPGAPGRLVPRRPPRPAGGKPCPRRRTPWLRLLAALPAAVVLPACASRGPSAAPATDGRGEGAVSPAGAVASPGAGASRAEFARAMAEVREGTPEADVRRLLGAPDDVRTESDPGGVGAEGVKEVWRYGASEHLGCATLGVVYMGDDGIVQWLFGNSGTPPAPALFDETELRGLLGLLDAVPSYNEGAQFDPRPLIRAVNALQPLGKERALAAISEYLRVVSPYEDGGYEGTLLVLRTLFDVPEAEGGLPPMLVGAPSPPAPEDPGLLPRFPLLFAGDIPFLAVRGYMLGGEAQPPGQHVEYYREHGAIRAAPLRPADDPLGALEEALRPLSVWATAACGEPCVPGPSFLVNQALLLLDDVLRKEEDVYGERFSTSGAVEPRWRALREEVAGLGIRWDAEAACYVFADGSTLPPPEPLAIRRIVWPVPREGFAAEVVLERVTERFVRVEIRVEVEGASAPALRVRLGRSGGDAVPALVETEIRALTGTTVEGRTIELPVGLRVVVEAVVGDETFTSAELEP
ncbi:MAG: hypothetical protein HY905_09675 [Deltaproteobacteria bacterium]|nr:hypothetical protein [Deltaproteobacteria bacterium]